LFFLSNRGNNSRAILRKPDEMHLKSATPPMEMRRLLLRRAAIIAAWTERHAMGNNLLALVLVVLAVIMGVVTYGAMTAHSPLSSDPNRLILLLNIDLQSAFFIMASMAGLIPACARRSMNPWPWPRPT
jgi:hypothetical protein